MPNNREEREAEVKAKYEFYVPGGEYSVFNALLAAADVIITGGNFTYQYLKDEVQKFGIDLAEAMAKARLDPLNETLYFDKFFFENWEQPSPWCKVPLPNKFVPYVAARKKPASGPHPATQTRISLWKVDDQGNQVNSKEHGPYADWVPLNCSDNRILWRHVDGRISLWKVDDQGNQVNSKEHGPYADWVPLNCSDNRILWRG